MITPSSATSPFEGVEKRKEKERICDTSNRILEICDPNSQNVIKPVFLPSPRERRGLAPDSVGRAAAFLKLILNKLRETKERGPHLTQILGRLAVFDLVSTNPLLVGGPSLGFWSFFFTFCFSVWKEQF